MTTSNKVSHLFTLLSCLLLSLTTHANTNGTTPVVDPAAPVEPVVEEYHGPKIIVNVAARRLYFYDQDQLLKTYPIAVGSSSYRTPLGGRQMTQIIWNPWWLPPASDWARNAKPTPPGPGNPLGPVKMDLGNAILFHGTNKPHSIGRAASHGCMRMNSADAKEFATFIQQHYTLQSDPALFAEYEAKKGRSFTVKLDSPIPVDIIYDLVDVVDGQLTVWSDVYYRFPKKMKESLIEQALREAGVQIAQLDAPRIYATVLEAKNKDVSSVLSEYEVGKAPANPADVGDTKTIAIVN
jgi:hypothetical protein